ncbi:uncharacterized protein PHACADRAFT_191217 [Phanerochaete carnosa HHB-10118-sp]|uniref:Uncharacterized protein n=1 Tax=Phanerochaete carnosa (strain HHB-10118-sp) TaxID=650164 RepID=K5V813_PHACS|nr:uncharacterized protein PHACADRAFT_191217 [Phanerochaete carnosa HHB-10118-sp]EKM58906.1 hypothetical protein PHACADRAFT_191217 [Phanerochaete carnosa HHB-10118-sp]
MFCCFCLLFTSDDIYSSSLQMLHLGHALWYPEPHESGKPQIGDVGVIHEGAFIRLFNLDTSTLEKKVTFWNPQFENAEPLPPGVPKIDRRHQPFAPGQYCSHGVESEQQHTSSNRMADANVSPTFAANYTCKAAQGAILSLKSEAHVETVLELGNGILENYIAQHHNVKTEADWAVAAFCNVSTSSSASVEDDARSIAEVRVGWSQSRSVTGPRMQRHGQYYLPDASLLRPAEPTRDQCVLLKRCKLRKRLGILKIFVGAGHRRHPDVGKGRGGSGDEGLVPREEGLNDANMPEFEGESEIPDTLDILLDYILENGKYVVNFASYLCHVQPPVQVDGTLGLICTGDMISLHEERTFPRRTITSNDFKLVEHRRIFTTSSDQEGTFTHHAITSTNSKPAGWSGYRRYQRIFTGSSEKDALPPELQPLIFVDLQALSARCKRFSLSTNGKLLAAYFANSDILIW